MLTHMLALPLLLPVHAEPQTWGSFCFGWMAVIAGRGRGGPMCIAGVLELG